MRSITLILAWFLVAGTASAREGFSIATGVMALTNSTTQGGQGAKGSTILTQTDVTYSGTWWGAGLFLQLDKQGEHETDTALGPRLEAHFDPLYVELAYAVMMNRSFTDRAIAEQTGNGLTLGVGARFPIGSSNAFYQFSYKYRSQNISKQDGTKLDETITQTDGYPLFGIGIGF